MREKIRGNLFILLASVTGIQQCDAISSWEKIKKKKRGNLGVFRLTKHNKLTLGYDGKQVRVSQRATGAPLQYAGPATDAHAAVV